MRNLPHLAARMYGRPLMLLPAVADIFGNTLQQILQQPQLAGVAEPLDRRDRAHGFAANVRTERYADKPYTVTTYDLIDRMAKPPTVKPGREYSRHKTASAAQRSAKQAARGCIMSGPSNLAVVEGPDIPREIWFKQDAASQHGAYVSISLRPVMHRGGFTVIEAPAGPASDLSPAQG